MAILPRALAGLKLGEVNLLAIIREIMCGMEEHLQHTLIMVQADKCLFTAYQQPHSTNDEWLKLFVGLVIAFQMYGGEKPKHPILLDAMLVRMGASMNM